MNKTITQRIPFQSKSNPANSYETLVYDDGSLSCNCPGWTRRNTNNVRECKHTQLVEQMQKQSGGIVGGERIGKGKTKVHATAQATGRKFDLELE